MFTRRDFREYVAELREIELKMQAHYGALVDRIEDDALRMRFVALMQSETEHAEGLKRLESIALGGSDLALPALRWTVGRKVGALVVVLLVWLCGALAVGWVMHARLRSIHETHMLMHSRLVDAIRSIRDGSLRQRLDLADILRDSDKEAATVPLPVRMEEIEIRSRGMTAALNESFGLIQNGEGIRSGEEEVYRLLLGELGTIRAILPRAVDDTESILRAVRLDEPEIPRPLLESMEGGWSRIDAAAQSAEDGARMLSEGTASLLRGEAAHFRTLILLLGLGGILTGTLLGAAVTIRLRNHFRTLAEAARQVTECVMADNIPTANVEVTGSDEASVLAYLWNAMVTAYSDDIRRRKKLEAELSLNTTTDRLTGALNRRKCEETMISEVARAKRYKTPLSLLLVDIDGFRVINDTHGLEVGDSVIAEIGERVRTLIRDSDFLFRFGGEEFLVLGPSTDIQGASILGEKIRALVEKTEIGVAGRVTVSVGVAEYKDGDEVRTLLKRVDDALYAAKKAGRNCVHVK